VLQRYNDYQIRVCGKDSTPMKMFVTETGVSLLAKKKSLLEFVPSIFNVFPELISLYFKKGRKQCLLKHIRPPPLFGSFYNI